MRKFSAKFGRNKKMQNKPQIEKRKPTATMIYFMYTIINPSLEITNLNPKWMCARECVCVHTVYQVATRTYEQASERTNEEEKRRNGTKRELIAFIKFYVERLQEINPEYRLLQWCLINSRLLFNCLLSFSVFSSLLFFLLFSSSFFPL